MGKYKVILTKNHKETKKFIETDDFEEAVKVFGKKKKESDLVTYPRNFIGVKNNNYIMPVYYHLVMLNYQPQKKNRIKEYKTKGKFGVTSSDWVVHKVEDFFFEATFKVYDKDKSFRITANDLIPLLIENIDVEVTKQIIKNRNKICIKGYETAHLIVSPHKSETEDLFKVIVDSCEYYKLKNFSFVDADIEDLLTKREILQEIRDFFNIDPNKYSNLGIKPLRLG